MAKRSPWPGVISASVVAALAGVAVLANGFEVQQTELGDGAVWAVQRGQSNSYARVNTRLGELELVREAVSVTELVQTADTALLLANDRSQQAAIDVRMPTRLDDTSYSNTPAGTAAVVANDSHIAYRTVGGQVFLAPLGQGGAPEPVRVDPYADREADGDGERPEYRVTAIALTESDRLFLYSSQEQTVRRYSLSSYRFDAEWALSGIETSGDADGPTAPLPGDGDDGAEGDDAGAPQAESPGLGGVQLSAVGGDWVLLDAAGALWRAGHDTPVDLPAGGLLQQAGPASDQVFVATTTGLLSIDVGESAVRTEYTVPVPGGAVRPMWWQGEMFAAWLPAEAVSGSFWRSSTGGQALSFDGLTLPGDADAVFQDAGRAGILNDRESGWVWTLPTGALVPASQDWSLGTESVTVAEEAREQAQQLAEPRAPVAVDDAFGVRPGSVALLPVLLNDYDANGDVITIDPASIAGWNEADGAVRVASDGQALTVALQAGASGTFSLQYRISDGTRSGGRLSEPATVQLRVVPETENTAPVWCEDLDACLISWPSPEVRPGGTVEVPVLNGWIDAEGDPVHLQRATLQSNAVGTVVATARGTVAYRHPDPNGTSGPVVVEVVVADSRGMTASRQLTIAVTPTPVLKVNDFAVLTSAGERLMIDPAEHISGISGGYRISTVKAPEGSPLSVRLEGDTTFSVLSSAPGSYPVSFVVADDATERLGQLRVVVAEASEQAIATTPITVFVQGKQDTTVDVFPAVSNPNGRPLLLTGAEWTGAASGEVEVVEQRLLRVRGTTPDGAPGVVGTIRFTVTDGTSSRFGRAEGQATVISIAAPENQLPIAADDRVTVRAGEQLDIPVLDNDLAPVGLQLVLDPNSVVNESEAGLAFASGDRLRYLAPNAPGEYLLQYSVYSSGFSGLRDTATVAVTVLPPGANAAPRPEPLTARVIAGQSVQIPVSTGGVDPDGDPVYLDRVLSQPASGSAGLTADGQSLLYRSVAGFEGVVAFEYQVRDRDGATASNLVRVMVLDQSANPAPAAFTDYVEVRLGAQNTVLVHPLLNDIDPGGSTLSLLAVEPDSDRQRSPEEYAALDALIVSTTSSQVLLRAGEELGTFTFRYTVVNAFGDRSVGLIVMKVIRSSVMDLPTVTDTHLTAAERGALESGGVDVLTGKVSWNGGDAAGLSLSLYGTASGFSTDGWRIRGQLPNERTVVPFEVRGTGFAGEEVVSYGFLHIPARDELVVILDPAFAAPAVDENSELTIDLNQAVAVPPRESVVWGGDASPSGQRPEAECTMDTAGTLHYRAGLGAPWSDFCIVTVRYGFQSSFSVVAVPLRVIPEEPQPVLRTAAITHSPASEAIEYDLFNMVGWEGTPRWDELVFEVDVPAGVDEEFTVEHSGRLLSLYANDTARVGAEKLITVRAASHPEAAAAVLRLRVGPAPSTLPRGGHVVAQCRQSEGESCVVAVVGVSEQELNIYRHSELKLHAVEPSGNCQGVSFALVPGDGKRVRIGWDNTSTPGQTCQAAFSVSDVRGSVSAPEGAGSVILDLRGFPKSANRVEQVQYEADSIRLRVTPAPAESYPVVRGFTVYQDGQQVAECSAAGRCSSIAADGAGTPLVNGEKLLYTVRSFSDEGESVAESTVRAWPFRVPVLDAVSAVPHYSAEHAGEQHGAVRFTFTSTDDSLRGYRVSGAGSTVFIGDPGPQAVIGSPVGVHSFTVTPLSRFEVPSGTTSQSVLSRTVSTAVAGIPVEVTAGAVSEAPTQLSISGGSAGANYSPDGVTITHVVVPAAFAGNPCQTGADGQLVIASGTPGPVVSTPDITTNHLYRVWSCASNGFGVAGVQRSGYAVPWQPPAAADVASLSYTVERIANGRYEVTGFSAPIPGEPSGLFATRISNWSEAEGRSTVWGVPPELRVRYCLTAAEDRCGPESAAIAPAAESRAVQARVSGVVARCEAAPWWMFGGDSELSFTAGVVDPGAMSIEPGSVQFRTGPGEPLLTGYDGDDIPADAGTLHDLEFTLRWSGLDPAFYNFRHGPVTVVCQ